MLIEHACFDRGPNSKGKRVTFTITRSRLIGFFSAYHALCPLTAQGRHMYDTLAWHLPDFADVLRIWLALFQF